VSDILLAVDRVSRYFTGVRAVDEVSCEIRSGELVGLIGPNGAGKTTLFNLIAGAVPPSAGMVRFAGHSLAGLDTAAIARRGIARTFQNLRIFPDVTVFDNVSVGAIGRHGASLAASLRPGGASRRDRAIADDTLAALARFGLSAKADLPAGNLSYGEKKLLEIARAVTTRPKLLLLDEPAAGLNPTETASLATLLEALRGEGITILLVEHDMPMVTRLCDRIIVLNAGRKIADGKPAAIRADPAVRAAYLGTAA
jgi:branched-chain amino acid transport system ATP-binding protein